MGPVEPYWIQFSLDRSLLQTHELDQLSFEELNKSSTLVNQTNSTVWLLGDFNLPKLDWEHLKPKPDCSHPTFYRECVDALSDCMLEQMVTSPTRGQNKLDLFFTTNPTLVDDISVIPDLSDHDIVLAQANVKPEVNHSARGTEMTDFLRNSRTS